MENLDTTATITRTNRLPLQALLTGNAISGIGDALAIVAIPWFVLATTGSPAKAGITAFFQLIPAVLAGFFGGTFVDRLGYKRMSVFADLASMITVSLIPLLYYTVGLRFWQLLVLVFVSALINTPGVTARMSLVPDVAGLAGTPLERANSAAQAIQSLAYLVGLPLAGVLIAPLGASRVLWVDAVTFGISALLVAAAVPSVRKESGDRGRYLQELTEGLRFSRGDRLLVSLLITLCFTNFLDTPLFSVVLPVFARTRFSDPVALGLMVAGFGAGNLLGTMLYGVAGRRLPRRLTFAGAFVCVGLPFWVLATLPALPIAGAALFLSGLAAGPINPIGMTVLQERIPEELRGRVLGAALAFLLATASLGVLLDGYLVQQFGLRPVLIGIAACYLLTTLSLVFNPTLHEMDRTPNQ